MNYIQSVDLSIERPQQRKRKFNLMLGLKRCFNDFNDYFGIETKGDKIFYHTYLWATIAILAVVVNFRMNM